MWFYRNQGALMEVLEGVTPGRRLDSVPKKACFGSFFQVMSWTHRTDYTHVDGNLVEN